MTQGENVNPYPRKQKRRKGNFQSKRKKKKEERKGNSQSRVGERKKEKKEIGRGKKEVCNKIDDVIKRTLKKIM